MTALVALMMTFSIMMLPSMAQAMMTESPDATPTQVAATPTSTESPDPDPVASATPSIEPSAPPSEDPTAPTPDAVVSTPSGEPSEPPLAASESPTAEVSTPPADPEPSASQLPSADVSTPAADPASASAESTPPVEASDLNAPVAQKADLSAFGIQVDAAGEVTIQNATGQTDVVYNTSCVAPASGFPDLNCTANDVSLATTTNVVITDGCAFPGDTATFSADFEVQSTATERYDVGIWFATDGDPNGDGAKTGTCAAATTAYAPSPPWVDLDGQVGGVQDTCGDITSATNLYPNVTLTVTCVDDDGDGKLDLPYITSWRIPGDNGLCTSADEAYPSTKSKCKSDTGFEVDVPVPGQIIVDKVTAPGSYPTSFSFTLSGTPTGGAAIVPVQFSLTDTAAPFESSNLYGGTYSVVETVNADYTTAAVCSDGSPANAVVVAPGEIVTCTFTNTLRTGTLKLVKTVVNNNGGTKVVSDFPLFMNAAPVTSEQVVSFLTGTLVTATETPVAGYTPSVWGGDCAANGTVTIVAGVNKTCTITNDDVAPELTLVKTVINDDGGNAVADDFALTVDGDPVLSGVTHKYMANMALAINETLLSGYTFTSITGNAKCPDVLGGTIILDEGDDITCTITNDDVAPKLTLVKTVINDDGGIRVAADFTLTATGYDPVSPDAGTYPLSETGPGGYTQTSLTCSNAVGEVTSVTLGLGETVTCTFVNDDDALRPLPTTDMDEAGAAGLVGLALTITAAAAWIGRKRRNS